VRHGDEWVLMVLVLGPAVFGLAALAGSILLFATTKKDTRDRVPRLVAATILLVGALGVGACYGVMWKG
jgi:hypothetical protein